MQRRVRGCCELPRRQARGEASSSSTEAPASRAHRAAHNAALPPPMTRTSGRFTGSGIPGWAKTAESRPASRPSQAQTANGYSRFVNTRAEPASLVHQATGEARDRHPGGEGGRRQLVVREAGEEIATPRIAIDEGYPAQALGGRAQHDGRQVGRASCRASV